jgi:hypothetical protein
MISLNTDQATQAFLCQTNELAEIRDCSGKVMGFYVPIDVYKAKLEVHNHHTVDFVKTFCGQHRTVLDHRTLRQIFEHLKTLTDNHAANANLQGHIDRMIQEDRDEWTKAEEG